MRYRISQHPHSIDGFGPRAHRQRPTCPAGSATPIRTRSSCSDKLWLFWRGGGWNPTFSYTEDRIRLGAGARAGLFGHGQRPYAKYVGDGDSRIHGIFTDGHPEDFKNSLYYLRYESRRLFAANGAQFGDARRRAVAHLQARPHLQVLRRGGRAWGARHRAHRRGPAARRLHAPGRQPRHVLLRLLQRQELGQPQDRRGRSRPPVVHSGGATLDHEDPRFVYLSRTIGRWNQVERWFTPDNGRTWTHAAADRRPRPLRIRPVTPRGLTAPTGSSTSRGDERTIGFTNYTHAHPRARLLGRRHGEELLQRAGDADGVQPVRPPCSSPVP